MLSDEQKEAIEYLKKYTKWETYGERNLEKDIITTLNLVDKLQKENEELKEKNKTLKSLQNDTNGLYIEMTERKNYFERELQKVEDKIKAKIEELIKEGNYRTADNPNGRVHFQKEFTDYQIEVLQSLLEKE